MRPRPARRTSRFLAASALVLALLAGCGGSDRADGSDGSPGPSGSPSVSATGGEDPEGGGAETDVASVPESGLSFAEAFDDGALSPQQVTELSIILGVLGHDHPGYVSGSTVVLETTEDDPDARLYTCIAADRVPQDEFDVLVVDEDRRLVDC